eukprot:6253113-Amphidinium_carterae.3
MKLISNRTEHCGTHRRNARALEGMLCPATWLSIAAQQVLCRIPLPGQASGVLSPPRGVWQGEWHQVNKCNCTTASFAF